MVSHFGGEEEQACGWVMLTSLSNEWGETGTLYDAGFPPMNVVAEKPLDHWQTFMSLPDARQACGVHGDDSDDDKIVSLLNGLINKVEGWRGAGRPLTKTEYTCFYPDLAYRLLLNKPGPSPTLASYSDLQLTLTRMDSDYTVPADEYFIDDSGDYDALVVENYSELKGPAYKRGLRGPVQLQYAAEPKQRDPDWAICHTAVMKGLELLYHTPDDDPVAQGMISRAISRSLPNRIPVV